MSISLALIGCGKMGQALLTGWLKNNPDYEFTVIQPDPLPDNYPQDGYNYYTELPANKSFDIIVFAVKPQILNQVIKSYSSAVHESTLILSIAAGKDIKSFEKFFGSEQPIIRIMPNTPASIGEGISALIGNNAVTEKQKELATNLFETCGTTLWLDHENQMDAVTAVSGSGPAYLFYMIEALTYAAETAGIETEKAQKLARQTIIGAAALAKAESDTSPETLRENVTSPGGTTEAGLSVLMGGTFKKALTKTVLAAKARSEELKS